MKEYRSVLTINSNDFDSIEDFILYWDIHIEKIKEDERLMSLFLQDFQSLELKYVHETTEFRDY